jgi:hypothetical protein
MTDSDATLGGLTEIPNAVIERMAAHTKLARDLFERTFVVDVERLGRERLKEPSRRHQQFGGKAIGLDFDIVGTQRGRCVTI